MTGAASESTAIAARRDGSAAPLMRPNTRMSAASNNNINNVSSIHRQKGILRSSLVTRLPRSSEAGDADGNRARGKKDSASGARLRTSPVVEQKHCVPLRRRRAAAAEGHRRDHVHHHGDSDLRLRLEEKEILVEQLKSEVEILRVCSEKLRVLNTELQTENSQLRSGIAIAHEQISMLSSCHNPNESQSVEKKAGKLVPPPPPPPPPPPLPRQPRAPAARSPRYVQLPQKEDATLFTSSAVPKTPSSILEFHHSVKLFNQQLDMRKEKTNEAAAAVPTSTNISLKPGNLHNSIVGEIQSRSSYLLAIKADVENKGEFINHVIQKIKNTVFEDIEELLTFVEWLDKELSSLSDERAVLKHFEWPEKKTDAMREAAFEYRDLKHLLKEISCYQDDPNSPSEFAFKKVSYMLDKSEKSIDKLNKLRESCIQYYRDSRIPTDWMLQSGVISKIKLEHIKLVKLYLKRVLQELESSRNMDRECSRQTGLLRQSVHYAYRAHQFAGGLDKDIMSALDEIRAIIPNHKK